MDFGILGPLAVRHDGRAIEIGALKLRTLLIRLLIDYGSTVPTDRLVEDLWEGGPPAGAMASLRAYVSNLRRFLPKDDDGSPLVTRGGAYALEGPPDAVDAERFATAVGVAGRQREDGDLEGALAGLEAALALWRGPALVDVAYASFAQPTIHRLDELRQLASGERTGVLLALGRHDAAIPDLESMIAAEPLRERAHRQLSLALYRAGRASEALEVHRRWRERLAEDVGLDPSPRFDALAVRILRQDEALDVAQAAGTPSHQRGPGGRTAPPSATAGAASAGTSPGIVGRDQQLRQLLRLSRCLTTGDGAVVLLAGEPGIGKTTLLGEFARQVRGSGMVHWGRCPESEGAPGFWPWEQVLRSVVDSAPPGTVASAVERWPSVLQLLPESAQGTGTLSPSVSDPAKARFALFEATVGFLIAMAVVRPLVVVLDDLHWADPASLDLLAFVGERLRSSPVFVAASYRTALAERTTEMQGTLARLHRSHAVELHLKGLRPEETGELVAASGRSTDAAEIAVLHDRTDGNPFFVQQLVQFLGEDPDRRANAVIPTGVRHVIANRLQLLPTSTRQVLEAAAIAGRAFDTRLVATIVGRSTAETMDDLDLAFEHELIEPDDPSAQRHRFVHALIQETLREGLSPMMGARLHAATAEALEAARDAAPAALAEHLWLAGDLAPAGATVKALVVAADAATASLAHEQAELLLRRALRVLVAGPSEDIDAEVDVRSRLLNLLTATTGWSSADLPMIADRVLQLVDEIGLRPDLLPLWHLLWTGFTARGDMERSRAVATELRQRAEAVGDALFVHTADLLLGYLDTQAGDDLPATLDRIILAREGLDRQPDAHLAATPEHMGVTARLIEVNARGFLDGADATADAEQLIAYAEQVGRPFSRMAAYLFAGDAAVSQGKAAAAADWTQRGLDLCKRHGFAGAHHLLVPANAWARVQLGANVSEQAGRVAESLSAIEADRGQVTAKYLLVHAALLGRAGDPDGARDRLGRARQWVAATGEHVYDPIIDRAEAALTG